MFLRLVLVPLLLTALTSSYAGAKEEKPPLRIAIPFSLAPPLLVYSEGQSPKGIVKDQLDAIQKRLKREFTYVIIPKFRIHELISKKMADVNCFTSPSWIPSPEKYRWTKALFLKKDVLVSRQPGTASLSSLRGQRVGTVLRYVYPNLDTSFQKGRLIREDAPTEEQNLQKFIKGRLENVVADEIHLDYFLKKQGTVKENFSRLVVQEYPIHCLISSPEKGLLLAFNNAIDHLKDSGEMEQIFKQYK